jgi:hypothetical protein
MGSRHLASNPTLTAIAFVGTNPTDESITSDLPVIRSQSSEDDALRQEMCVKFVGGNWPDITRRHVAPSQRRLSGRIRFTL